MQCWDHSAEVNLCIFECASVSFERKLKLTPDTKVHLDRSMVRPPFRAPQGGAVRLHQTEPTISDRGNITIFPKSVGLALQVEPKRRAHNQLAESETLSIISDMACTISHDM